MSDSVENYQRWSELTSQVEKLREEVAALSAVATTSSSTVYELAENITTAVKQLEATNVQSWLAVEDEEKALLHLSDLQKWLREVWVHYDGATLPECWAYHPGVVEELWVLMNLHRAVFRKGGTWQGLADWQARYRPGVAERIGKVAARCSLARHERGYVGDPTDSRGVPDGFDPAAIAAEWTTGRQVPFAPVTAV